MSVLFPMMVRRIAPGYDLLDPKLTRSSSGCDAEVCVAVGGFAGFAGSNCSLLGAVSKPSDAKLNQSLSA